MLGAQKMVESWVRSLGPTKITAPPVPDLLSTAAHELRTPLTTLLAQAQDIERRLIEDPHRRPDPAAVHRIASEARRLRTLIQALLDAAAVEAGQLITDREPVNLVDLAREACASSGGDRATVEASGPVIGVYDRERMRLVLEALIENAAKYGGDLAPVRVIVWRQDELAYVAVRDRGMGIPAGDLPHVFDRFSRGANAADHSVPGLGLGLYLAKAIVQAHGGAIAVHSTPLDGTTVTVALPSPAGLEAGHATR